MCSYWASLQQKATLWLFCAPLRWNMTFATLLSALMGQGWRLFFSEALPSLSLQQRIEGLSMDEVKSPTGNLFPSTKARKPLVFGCMNSIEPIERIPIGTLANGSLSLRRFVEKCGEKTDNGFWRAITLYMFLEKKKIGT